MIPQRRLQAQEAQEETPRKQGDTMCIIVSDAYYRPVFSESSLGFGVSSGEFRDRAPWPGEGEPPKGATFESRERDVLRSPESGFGTIS